MNNSRFFAALLLAFPLAAAAQTTTAPAKSTPAPASPAASAPAPPPPGMQQVTEVTEDLDPNTGKVIRRTTRTVNVPIGSVPAAAAAGTATPATTPASPTSPASPSRTTTTATTSKPTTTSPGPATPSTTATLDNVRATDAQVSAFLGRKTAVATLSGPALVDAYNRFLEKVRNDRHNWRAANWATASAVMSSLNTRYEQLRPNLSFDDKLTVRSHQAEYQALRTARQVSDQVSDKL